ncbi:MAG: hypothetical protein ACREFI_10425 [Stellaceae bacterium]
MNRAEQLHDQAEFLRSLAAASSIASKREQLLRAAEQCELLADTFGQPRPRPIEPAPLDGAEPYLRIPGRAH